MINQNSKQAGVTLLLAVLIMSGLILVSLAVATFTIQEIRASRAQIISEPALIAAESGAEEALWKYKRNEIVPNCPPTGTATSQSLTNSNSLVLYCKSYAGDTFNLEPNTPITFYLYDPSDISGDVDLLAYPYSWISVTNQSNSFSISVNVQRLDSTPLSAVLVNPNTTRIISIPAVAAGSEGRMQVTLLSTGDPSAAVDTDKGLPHVVNLDANGCSARATVSAGCSSTDQELFNRRIQVKLK